MSTVLGFFMMMVGFAGLMYGYTFPENSSEALTMAIAGGMFIGLGIVRIMYGDD